MHNLTCEAQGGNEYHVLSSKVHIATIHVVLKKWYVQYHDIRRTVFSQALPSKETAMVWIQIVNRRLLEGKAP